MSILFVWAKQNYTFGIDPDQTQSGMGDATGDGRERLSGGSIKAKELGIQRGDA